MKILCSGGIYDEIEQEDCLRCARELRLPPCGFTEGVLRKIYDTESRPDVHVTDAISCLLKAYYDKTREVPYYPHDRLVLFYGIAIHASLEGDGSEIEVELEGIKGRIDYVLDDGSIVDYKTTRWIKKGAALPYKHHIDQVTLYAYMRQQMGYEVGRLYIQYLDVSGPTRCKIHNRTGVIRYGKLVCPVCDSLLSETGGRVYEVYYDPELGRELFERAKKLKACLENGEEPPADPGWICSYCPHECRFRQE